MSWSAYQDRFQAMQDAKAMAEKDKFACESIAKLTKERDEARAACGEMRSIIERHCYSDNGEKLAGMIPANVGRGWKSPEEWAKLEAELKKWKEGKWKELASIGEVSINLGLKKKVEKLEAELFECQKGAQVIQEENQKLEACCAQMREALNVASNADKSEMAEVAVERMANELKADRSVLRECLAVLELSPVYPALVKKIVEVLQ